jgi:hypothetical protein
MKALRFLWLFMLVPVVAGAQPTPKAKPTPEVPIFVNPKTIPLLTGPALSNFMVTLPYDVTGLNFLGTDIQMGTPPSSGQCLQYNGTVITGAPCGGGGGGGGSSCGGTVTLSTGTGTASDTCILTTGVPLCVDTTAFNDVTCVPAAGTMAITGTGSDVIVWSMVNGGGGSGGGGSGSVGPGTGPAIPQYNVGTGTVVGPVTLSGDCTLAQGGAMTCLSTNGAAFAALATLGVGNGLTSSGGNLMLTIPVAVANGGTGTTTAPSAGQIAIAQSGTTYAPKSASGDCTINSAGAVTCTKTNGTAFTALATATSPLPVANGGTAATTAGATAAHNIGAAAQGANSDITSLSGLTTPLSVAQGGTAGTAANATTANNIGAAAKGANADITSLSALSTPLSVAQGGTGGTVANATTAHNVGAAALGANSDITSLTGLTTPLSKAQGGNGTASPAFTAGTGLGVSGTWPAQQFALTTPVLVANGGTQCGAPVAVASLPASPTQGEICNVTDDSTGCTAGTPVVTGGSGKCQVTWNGTSWLPAGGAVSAATGGVSSLAGTANQINASAATGAVTLSLIGPYTPATFTAHGLLKGEGTSSIAAMAACATGTVIYGQTGADPICSTLTLPNAATTGDLFDASGTNAMGRIADVATGQVLISGGVGVAPSYSSAPAISGANFTAGTVPNAALVTAPVTAVNVTAPITTSGGTTPTIGLTSPLGIANGGTGVTTAPSAGQVVVGQTATTYAPETLSGDCTMASSGAITCTKTGGVAFSGAATATLPLSVANGGTGTASPGLTAGTGLGVSGSFPTQQFALTTPVTVANGGTQCGVPVVFASLPATPTNGEICNVTDAPGCTAGTPVTTGSSTTKCQVTYNGTNWMPAGGAVSAASGGVTSATGTANQVAVSAATGAVTFSLVGPYTPATYTAHGVLVGEGISSITPTLVGGTGSFLYGQGAAADPIWSTLLMPNAATTGDLLGATATNSIGRIADVATGQVLTSGGVGVAPAWSSAPTISGANISPLKAPYAATSYTTHGLIVGEASSNLAAMAVCPTGTFIYGQSGADPICSTLTLPNAATTGDIMTATGTNAIGSVPDVATGQVLISKGVGVAPGYSATPTFSGANITTATIPNASLVTTPITACSGDLNSGCTQVGGLHFGASALPNSSTAPTSGQFLQWNGTNIVGGTPVGSGTVASGTVGQMGFYAVNGTTISGNNNVTTTPGGIVTVGGLTNNCKGSVTLATGSGTATNACITATSFPICTDTTAPNPVSCTPNNGSMTITGTGTDAIAWIIVG